MLSWHVADDDGEPTARSLFVDDVCDLFEERLSSERLRRPLGAVEATGALRAASRPRAPSVRASAVATSACSTRCAERAWSASSLEGWIGCPMRWFVERTCSRPGAFDPEPEPLARGGLAHAALNDTLEGLRAETGSARADAGQPARSRASCSQRRSSAREHEHPLSVAPERRPGVRRRLRADLERYLAPRGRRREPARARRPRGRLRHRRGRRQGRGERAAGLRARRRRRCCAGASTASTSSERGEAVVYDYKSSSAPAPAKWIGEGKLQVALYMRAVEQLLGLRVVGGFYQPLQRLGPACARPARRRQRRASSTASRATRREHAEVRELLDEALARRARGRGRGGRAASSRPGRRPALRKGGCEFPTICRCER